MLDRISADSLRGHLSFLASDLLKGRDTPSPGLDIAAEYIAAQFRRAGLEPIGDDGYFQTARWTVRAPDSSGFSLTIRLGERAFRLAPDQISMTSTEAIDLDAVPVVKLDPNDDDIDPAEVADRVILADLPDPRNAPAEQREEVFRTNHEFLNRMAANKASLVMIPARNPHGGTGLGDGHLVDPEGPPDDRFSPRHAEGSNLLTIHDPDIIDALSDSPMGPTGATLSLHIDAPEDRPVTLRNVVGLLRGSDPQLSDTYILVSAHYDHIGMGSPVDGDAIYNGANDDGSGTVSVIELASALATLEHRPKRSIVFVTFFGEEKGLLGSRYYARHPVVPIEKTVAGINLELVGRTDDIEDGPQNNRASMTGFDYSDVGPIFQAAGETVGVRIVKHPKNSDLFFGRSDNQALADRGVPAQHALHDVHVPRLSRRRRRVAQSRFCQHGHRGSRGRPGPAGDCRVPRRAVLECGQPSGQAVPQGSRIAARGSVIPKRTNARLSIKRALVSTTGIRTVRPAPSPCPPGGSADRQGSRTVLPG